MRVANPSPILDKDRAPMGPEIISSTGAGVWRKAPKGFPDSSSVLDKIQSAKNGFTKTLFALFFKGFSPANVFSKSFLRFTKTTDFLLKSSV